jgi:dihydrofolate reductase
MRKLIEATFVSLDGVIESPERWALQLWGPEHRADAARRLDAYDAFLFGRVTYEKFAAAWSRIEGDPYYDRINRMPKYVASTTLTTTTWNATLLTGDVAEAVSALKQQPGKDIIKYGGGVLDRTLIHHQLIDEFQINVFPLTVGQGARLFDGVRPEDLRLELTNNQTLPNGIVQLTYVRR